MAGEEPAPVPASAVLMSASKLIATECGGVSRAFIECKKRDPNPEACLPQGDAVTSCVIDLCANSALPILQQCNQHMH